VKGDISLENLGLSIKYFYYILGSDTNSVLSKFRCDPYLADLEVAYDFLIIHHTKKKSNEEKAIGVEKQEIAI